MAVRVVLSLSQFRRVASEKNGYENSVSFLRNFLYRSKQPLFARCITEDVGKHEALACRRVIADKCQDGLSYLFNELPAVWWKRKRVGAVIPGNIKDGIIYQLVIDDFAPVNFAIAFAVVYFPTAGMPIK